MRTKRFRWAAALLAALALTCAAGAEEPAFVSGTFSFVVPELVTKQELTPLDLTQVTKIALHHMQHPTADFREVEEWHLTRGFDAIGYNFWVDFEGTVYVGRGFNQGAAVANQNKYILSIGFQGDYESPGSEMPEAQFKAGVALIRWLQEQVPTAVEVGGHGSFGDTECPGKYFPLQQMVSQAMHTEVPAAN